MVFFQNEEILKKATTDYQEKLKRSEEKYRMLKKHAEEKIERFCSVLFCAIKIYLFLFLFMNILFFDLFFLFSVPISKLLEYGNPTSQR